MVKLQILLNFLIFQIVNGIIFDKCELAVVFETRYGMSRDEVKNWLCIAEHESTFNTEAINRVNWDGSWDYGLFQLNSKYWCKDHHQGKNECRMPCTSLLDADLTDDLLCIKKIIKDTEAWKGKGTGLTAWVAYVNRCQNRNLDEYISECLNTTLPLPGEDTESNVIDTRISHNQQTTTLTSTTQPPSTTTPYPSTTLSPSTTSPSTSANNIEASEPQEQAATPISPVMGPSENVNDNFIPSARIPLPSTHFIFTLSPAALTYTSLLPTHTQRLTNKNIPKSQNARSFLSVLSKNSQITSLRTETRALTVIQQGSPLGPSLTLYS